MDEDQARSQTMNTVGTAASSTGTNTVMRRITTFRSTTDRIYEDHLKGDLRVTC